MYKFMPIFLTSLLLACTCGAEQAPTPETVQANGLVVLLTDYGADSVYVGAIKGAIYAKSPGVRVDSITNSVPEFDILAGAFCLAEACGLYPRGVTFCCVVDPGVGTERRVLVMQTQSGHFFVAPDNGLLTLVADKLGVAAVYEGTNRALWREPAPSRTFHGRDVFGPIAASLAGGTPIGQVGKPISDFVRLDIPRSTVEGNAASGVVIRVDAYGNLITNVPEEHLATLGVKQGDLLEIAVGNVRFSAPFVATYGDVEKGRRLALIQSAGYLELAVNLGSLAAAIGEGVYAPVVVRKAS